MDKLRKYELLLLKHSCGLSTSEGVDAPTDADADGDLSHAASLIIRGRYLDALKTVPALTALLDCSRGPDADAVLDAESYYALISNRAAAIVAAATPGPNNSASAANAASGAATAGVAGGGDGSHGASGGAVVPSLDPGAVLVAGVAALHVFVQHNLTGPSHGAPPPSPLDLFAPPAVAQHFSQPPPRPPAAAVASILTAAGSGSSAAAAGAAAETPTAAAAPEAPAASAAAAAAAAGGSTSAAASDGGSAAAGTAPPSDGLGGLGVDSTSRGDRWAQQQLQLDGEDLIGRIPALQWLLLARTLLLPPLELGAAAAAAAGTHAAAAGTQGQQPPQPRPSPPSAAPTALPASWPWWALRACLSHQHCLEGRAHSLLAAVRQLMERLRGLMQGGQLLQGGPAAAAAEAAAGSSAQTNPEPAAAATGAVAAAAEAGAAAVETPASAAAGSLAGALAGVLHLECALSQMSYGYVEGGRQHLEAAGGALGLQPQITGAMGKRTVHQVDAKAQLVVVAAGGQRAAPPGAADVPVEGLGLPCLSGARCAAAPASRELEGLADESEVFPAPVLLGEGGRALDTCYSSPEQALLLGWATAVKKTTSADDLQEWQMAPWVEAVISQRRGAFMTAAAATLLKTRHERSRARTRERALLHMDCLAEALAGAGVAGAAAGGAGEAKTGEAKTGEGEEAAAAAAVAGEEEEEEQQRRGVEAAAAGQRAVLSWAVWFPMQVSLRKEAAEHYISMGLVGAAIRLFESLELWDAAISCYRLLGKKALAEELIHRRLAATPDDPRLWCALGDLHLDDRYYEEAWQRSGRRHTRSQRSLARSAMRRKDYPRAASHWEAALALNPLHPEAWFSLGFCHLKAERHRQALRAFTRVTQQEPDNGEAWNNIAALWMHLGGYRPAYAALSEAVRHKRDSWQTWENYGRAALASGHYQQAVRGLQMALQLSGGQRVYADVVGGLLDVLEGRQAPRDKGTSPQAAAAAAAEGLLGGGEAAAAAGAGEEELDASLQEDEAALGVPLLPLLADMPLATTTATTPPSEEDNPSSDPSSDPSSPQPPQPQSPPQQAASGQAGQSTSEPQQQQLLSGREREFVLTGLGQLLREAVNSPAAAGGAAAGGGGGAALWGCLARYWALRGEAESAKEARIKQVRALSGLAYKSDPARFSEFAEASQALGRAYLECYARQQGGGTKDLAAGRMHLRGLLRATAENFGEHPATAQLQALLEEITRVEDAAIAASKAAKGL